MSSLSFEQLEMEMEHTVRILDSRRSIESSFSGTYNHEPLQRNNGLGRGPGIGVAPEPRLGTLTPTNRNTAPAYSSNPGSNSNSPTSTQQSLSPAASATPSSFGRYADPLARESLINRLLAEHAQKYRLLEAKQLPSNSSAQCYPHPETPPAPPSDAVDVPHQYSFSTCPVAIDSLTRAQSSGCVSVTKRGSGSGHERSLRHEAGDLAVFETGAKAVHAPAPAPPARVPDSCNKRRLVGETWTYHPPATLNRVDTTSPQASYEDDDVDSDNDGYNDDNNAYQYEDDTVFFASDLISEPCTGQVHRPASTAEPGSGHRHAPLPMSAMHTQLGIRDSCSDWSVSLQRDSAPGKSVTASRPGGGVGEDDDDKEDDDDDDDEDTDWSEPWGCESPFPSPDTPGTLDITRVLNTRHKNFWPPNQKQPGRPRPDTAAGAMQSSGQQQQQPTVSPRPHRHDSVEINPVQSNHALAGAVEAEAGSEKVEIVAESIQGRGEEEGKPWLRLRRPAKVSTTDSNMRHVSPPVSLYLAAPPASPKWSRTTAVAATEPRETGYSNSPAVRPISGNKLNRDVGQRYSPYKFAYEEEDEEPPVPQPLTVRQASPPKLSARLEKLSKPKAWVIDFQESTPYRLEQTQLLDCTFAPKISKRSEAIIRNLQRHQETSERLHADAELRDKKLDLVKARLLLKARTELTFSPAINPKKSDLFSSLDYRPIYERVGEIERAHGEVLKELREMQRERDSEVMTFKPIIPKRSQALARRRASPLNREPTTPSSGNIHEAGSPSTPTPTPGPGPRSRVEDVDSEHTPGPSSLRSSASRAVGSRSRSRGLSKSPSRSHASPSASSSDVVARLEEEARLAKVRKAELMRARDKEVSLLMTPVKPCKGTEDIVKTSNRLSASFLDRQAMHQERVRSRSANREREETEARKALFKPALCRRSQEILSRIETDEGEQRIARLAKESIDVERRRKEADKKIYGKFTYAPSINPVSKALGRSSSLQELVDNPRGRRVRREAENRRQTQLSALFTFRPSTGSSPGRKSRTRPGRARPRSACSSVSEDRPRLESWYAKSVDDHFVNYATGSRRDGRSEEHCGDRRPVDVSGSESSARWRSQSLGTINMREPERMLEEIRLRREEREKRSLEAAAQREFAELSACPFKPRPFTPPPPSLRRVRDSVHVRGWERYLELQDLATRRRLQQARREEEVFGLVDKNKNFRAFGVTMVEPFQLSESRGRESRAVRALTAAQEAELTFAPKIADSAKRLTTRKLLQEYNNSDDIWQ